MMTTTKENDTNNEQQNNENNAKLAELVNYLYQHSTNLLQAEFPDDTVDGQVITHEVYGPLFTFRVKKGEHSYASGFFLRELLQAFQPDRNPSVWLSSFFVDLMKVPGDVLLPRPPQSEEEAKALLDNTILPHCFKAIKEEFEDEEVYSGLDLHQEHGPVLEAGFPKYKDGNNVVAMPLHLLIAHHLLNRDPADLIVQGLYRILDEQENGAAPQA